MFVPSNAMAANEEPLAKEPTGPHVAGLVGLQRASMQSPMASGARHTRRAGQAQVSQGPLAQAEPQVVAPLQEVLLDELLVVDLPLLAELLEMLDVVGLVEPLGAVAPAELLRAELVRLVRLVEPLPFADPPSWAASGPASPGEVFSCTRPPHSANNAADATTMTHGGHAVALLAVTQMWLLRGHTN
jgi:hypothetical protein